MSGSDSSSSGSDEDSSVSSLEIGEFKDGDEGSSEEESSSSGEEETEEDETEDGDDDEGSFEEIEVSEETEEDSGESSSDSDDDSDSEDEPKLKSAMKKSSMKQPQVSADAFNTFLSKAPPPEEDDIRPPPSRGVGRHPSLEHSDLAIKQAVEQNKKQMDDLDSSIHSLRSTEDLLAEMDKDLLGAEEESEVDALVPDIDIATASKEYKHEPGKVMQSNRPEIAAMREKREKRLARVRDRIRAKEEAKEREEDAKKLEKYENQMNGGFDMSENARRDRAYGWYTRMAMPSKEDMKERVAGMPSSSGISVEDVDLLPWAASGRMVNVAKMQKFINQGFKSKFTSRRKKKPVKKDDSDSDSD